MLVSGKKFKTKIITLCLLISFGFAGCDGSSNLSVEEHLERAQELLDNADFRGSVIELKNALQEDPNNEAARILLAEVHAEVGDGESAKKEIQKAIALGASGLRVQEVKGRAYILTQKFNELLQEFTIDKNFTAARRAIIAQLRGDAYFGLGNNVAANTSYRLAIKAYNIDINKERPHLKLTEPIEYIDALVGLAKVAIRRNLWTEAKETIEKALKIAPNDPESLAASAEISFKQGKYEESEIAYKLAFQHKPYDLLNQIGLARTQISLKKYDDATENLEAVRKHFPDHVITNQYRSLIALQLGDFETAKLFSDRMLKVAPDYIPAHLLAGTANYGLGNFEQANIFLSRFLSTSPKNIHARTLLGVTQLRLRRAEDAFATLQPLSEERSKHSITMNLIATAAVQSGDLTTASAYFQKAVDARPNDSEAWRQLALSKIARGDRDGGIKDLQDSIDRTPSYLRGKYTLMDLFLGERAYDKAIEIARELQITDSKNPAPFIGEGLAWTGKKSWKEAISAFKKAINLAPGHIGAAYGLADIHLRRNKIEDARSIYADILVKKKGHLKTILRWIGLETFLGNKKKVSELLALAILENPNAIEPKILAAQTLIEANKPVKAIASLSGLLRRNPNNPLLLQTVGQAQLAAKKIGEATVTLENLVQILPNSPSAHFLLALAYSQLDNQKSAISELGMALALDPKFLQARIAHVRALVLNKQPELAIKSLRDLKSKFPKNPNIPSLEGWVAIRLENFDKAILVLKEHLGTYPNEESVVQLASAMWKADRRSDAIKTLQKWSKNFSRSINIYMELGNYFALLKNSKDAINSWRSVVEISPNNWLALNNIAFALSEIDPGRSLGYAKRAYDNAPNIAPVVMTYAELLLNKNSIDRAIQVLRTFTAKNAGQLDAQFLLSKAQFKIGNLEISHKIIKKILSRNPNDALRQKVDDLLRKLKD